MGVIAGESKFQVTGFANELDKKDGKRIWILNHHARLNGHRHFEQAKYLAQAGYDVTIVASSFSHALHQYINDENCTVQAVQENIRYIWVRTSPAYQGNGIKRIINMISYLKMVRSHAKEWWREYGKPDFVIGSSVHPFAWEAAYFIARKTGAKFIAEVRDLWPLSLIELTGMPRYHPLVLLFELIEKRAYQRADKIFTTMPYAYKHICHERYNFPRDKVVWIPNGMDTKQIENSLSDSAVTLPSELQLYLQNNWCCVYAGSIVKSECIDFIIEAADCLAKQDNDICFAIIGDGEEKEKLKEKVRLQQIPNVRFFDRISKSQVAHALKCASCCCAALRDLPIYRYGLSLNKLNDYLFSGKPTVFACNAANVVRDSGAGIAVDFGNPKVLAEAILQVYTMSEEERNALGKKGIQVIKEQYDAEVIAKKIIDIL